MRAPNDPSIGTWGARIFGDGAINSSPGARLCNGFVVDQLTSDIASAIRVAAVEWLAMGGRG